MLNLMFAKTKFHQGRIALVYVQGGRVPAELGTLLSTNYNMIVDLNEISTDDGTNAQVSFNVPYLNNKPYASMIPSDPSDDVFQPYVSIYVLNPLKQPTGCEDAIDILTWISAGEDFELAVPTANVGLSSWNSEEVLPDMDDFQEADDWRAQAGSGFEANLSRESYSIVPGQKSQQPLEQSVACIGERVFSLRSITKRFSLAPPPKQYTTATVSCANLTSYPASSRGNHLCARDAVYMLYRFYYGGIRVKMPLNQNEVGHVTYYNARYLQQFVGAPGDGSTGNMLANTAVEINGNINNFLEYELPFYNMTRLNTIQSLNGDDGTRYAVYAASMRRIDMTPPTSDTSFGFTTYNVNSRNWQPQHAWFIKQADLTAFLQKGGRIFVGGNPIMASRLYSPLATTVVQLGGADNVNIEEHKCYPENIYLAASDTAGCTFLVAPPCFRLFVNAAGQHSV